MSGHDSLLHPSRRTILRLGGCALIAAGAGLVSGRAVFAAPPAKPLVCYFSHSGNTRAVAEALQFRLGAAIAEVKTVRVYSQDYDTVVDEAQQEQRANARPALAAPVPDFAPYDVIFLGYPSWWGTMPMCLFTLLEQNRETLAGRTIVPFCTHEGSGLGRGPADIRRLVPGATVAEGFDMRGRSVGRAQERVDKWLKQQGWVR